MRTNPVIEIRGERFALIPEQEYLELLGHVPPDASTEPDPFDLTDLVDADEFMGKAIGRTLKPRGPRPASPRRSSPSSSGRAKRW